MDNCLSDYDDNVDSMPVWQAPREEPLGAPQELCGDGEALEYGPSSHDRLHYLKEEQEMLSSSVFSLTSHLAQVEFRLRQVLKAPADEKDAMLKALEEFTSRGIPDVRASPQGSADNTECNECSELEEKVHFQKARQNSFIEKLKTQLKELETYTADTSSAPDGCSSKQKTLMEHMQQEINESLNDKSQIPFTAEELTHQVNCVIRQYTNNKITKEQIINKFQAHIEEMQNIISIMRKDEICRSVANNEDNDYSGKGPNNSKDKVNDDLKAETLNLMRKASTLIQIFTVSQFGCSPNPSKAYDKRSPIVTHWGNLRARLEMSIDSIVNLMIHKQTHQMLDSYDSDSEEDVVMIKDVPLTKAVRRHLAVNLRDLLQHGFKVQDSHSIVPMIACFPIGWSSGPSRPHHFWELILRYYEMNDGDAFNSTPARKLSQSFNLDIVGGTSISNKQSLLSAIGSILASHMPYKRSYDAHFKAFVCAALNAHKLVLWLNIILKCRPLIDFYYTKTSYVVNTGFQDALQSLDRLTPHVFDLPVDLAVKQFQNIKDVFM